MMLTGFEDALAMWQGGKERGGAPQGGTGFDQPFVREWAARREEISRRTAHDADGWAAVLATAECD